MKQKDSMNNKASAAVEHRRPNSAMKSPTTAQPMGATFASTGADRPASLHSWWTALRLSERVLLPLRLFLGITFIYAGIQKLTDPQFFNPSATGFIGKQIMAFAHGSPIQNILLHVALPHAVFSGAIIALGEIAFGIGT